MPRSLSKLQWHRITPAGADVALKIAAILTVTFTVFSQDLVSVFTAASKNEATGYILAAPLLFAYLIYRKRKMLRTVVPVTGRQKPQNTRHLASIAGVCLSATTALLHWQASLFSILPEIRMFALPPFVAGMCLILFNSETLKQLVFPVAFLYFLVLPQSEIAQTVSLIFFAVFIAYITRDKLGRKIALFITSIPLIYLLETARSATAGSITYNGSDTALQLFGLLSGWILVLLATLLLFATAEKTLKTSIFTKPAEKCRSCDVKPPTDIDYCRACGKVLQLAKAEVYKTDIVKLSAIILIAGLLLTLQAPVFAITQGRPTVAIETFSGLQTFNQILPQTDQYNLTFLGRDALFENRSEQNIGLDYEYVPLNQSLGTILVSVGLAPTQSSLERWETDLTAPRVSQIDLRDIQLAENPQITGRYYVFNWVAINQLEAILYWFEVAAFMVNSTWQWKYVEINLIAFPQTTDKLPFVEQELVTIAEAIVRYWQPVKAWSEATMLTSQIGIVLLTLAAIMLPLTIIYFETETRKRKKASLIASEKLGSLSKDIAKAVQKSKRPATLGNIKATFQENREQGITREQLEQTLVEMEKIGILRSSIQSQNDEPVQTWKV